MCKPFKPGCNLLAGMLILFLEMWECELGDLERTIKILHSQKAYFVVCNCCNYCGNISDEEQPAPKHLALPEPQAVRQKLTACSGLSEARLTGAL